MDEGVKRIVDALRAKRALRNTVLIYTSDNGYFHGEHRIPKDKQHIYEESIRVPLLMRGPGIPQGVRIGRLAINADLAPTIVDLANADAGLSMDGRSLIPVARHPAIGRGRAAPDRGAELRGDPDRALHVRRASTPARRSSTT